MFPEELPFDLDNATMTTWTDKTDIPVFNPVFVPTTTTTATTATDFRTLYEDALILQYLKDSEEDKVAYLKVTEILKTKNGLLLLYPDGSTQAFKNEDIKGLGKE